MATISVDITKLDLYVILNVDENASEKEIVKSYRKQALKCHPDKNPDNPDAAELFFKLSKALEVLTDVSARAAYDKTRKAKKAAEERHRVLDSKRKKLKEDLEARENSAQSQKEADLKAKINLQAEIERLRKEGSKLLEREQALLQEEIRKGTTTPSETNKNTPKLKVKWKAKKSDTTNGGYSYTVLYSIFVKYGNVLNLLVSSKKNGSAIVEMGSRDSAQREIKGTFTRSVTVNFVHALEVDFDLFQEIAVKNEKGLVDNPLTLTLLDVQSSSAQETHQDIPQKEGGDRVHEVITDDTTDKVQSAQPVVEDRDFESLVLMKMRQAEERKRLIEQMANEDDET